MPYILKSEMNYVLLSTETIEMKIQEIREYEVYHLCNDSSPTIMYLSTECSSIIASYPITKTQKKQNI